MHYSVHRPWQVKRRDHSKNTKPVALCWWVLTYSTMASRSAMSPSTMRWMMLLCSSSERFLYDTRGMLYFVAGEGSTPWSQGWFSISSKEALLLGSLCSIRVIRLERKVSPLLEQTVGKDQQWWIILQIRIVSYTYTINFTRLTSGDGRTADGNKENLLPSGS